MMIDSNALCKAPLLKNFNNIFSQGYNVQKVEFNAWLILTFAYESTVRKLTQIYFPQQCAQTLHSWAFNYQSSSGS